MFRPFHAATACRAPSSVFTRRMISSMGLSMGKGQPTGLPSATLKLSAASTLPGASPGGAEKKWPSIGVVGPW